MFCVEVGDKLAMARRYHTPGLGQKELAELLRVDTSTVGRWESKNHIPSDKLPLVSAILNVREEWFFDGSDEPPTTARRVPVSFEPPNIKAKQLDELTPNERRMVEGLEVAIPVWRGVVAGLTEECVFVEDEGEIRELPAFYTRGEPDRHILCIASGMSMAPRIEHAERALMRLDPDVQAGHLVVARSPDNRNYIKHLVKHEGRLELHSLNDRYPNIENLTGWVLKGGITAIFHAYEPGQPNIEWDDGRYLR